MEGRKAGLIPGREITPVLRLVRPLGAGGMGSVWVARHSGLAIDVAVKFVAVGLADNREALARFRREAAAAAKVQSPHVVQILDHGVTFDGEPYISMELLDGQDLADRLEREGVLPAREVTAILQQVARALDRAHERGVIHRDIKPNNIFLSDIGGGEAFVKVLDFGVAKVVLHDGSDTTHTGAVLGTPYYMSPEQILARERVTRATDLWSLAVVAFEAMTGRRPFDGDSLADLGRAICSAELPKPTAIAPHLPRAVDAWFQRACARAPQDRFASAAQMAQELERATGTGARVLVRGDADVDDADAPTVLYEPSRGKATRVEPAAFTQPMLTPPPDLAVAAQRPNAGKQVAPRSLERLDRTIVALVVVCAGLIVLLIAVVATKGPTPERSSTAAPTDDSAQVPQKPKPLAPLVPVGATKQHEQPTASAEPSTAAAVKPPPVFVQAGPKLAPPVVSVAPSASPSSAPEPSPEPAPQPSKQTTDVVGPGF